PRAGAPVPYLLLIGEGEERPRLEARLRNAPAAGGAGDVRLLGFRNQSELPRYYDLCDVFVLPSIHEPWGLVVNEAMNAGRAIVVSDQVGCQPDLVEDGDNGRVFPALDVAALADALVAVLANPAVGHRMGSRGLERIQNFSLEGNVRELMRAFHAAARHQR
ncbi:MAG: glycosyltransferase family 4 protein, partial [Pseudonocardiaceae bacterium]